MRISNSHMFFTGAKSKAAESVDSMSDTEKHITTNTKPFIIITIMDQIIYFTTDSLVNQKQITITW